MKLEKTVCLAVVAASFAMLASEADDVEKQVLIDMGDGDTYWSPASAGSIAGALSAAAGKAGLEISIGGGAVSVDGISDKLPRLSKVDGVGAIVIFQRVAVDILYDNQTRIFARHRAKHFRHIRAVGQRVDIVYQMTDLIDVHLIAASGHFYLIHTV